MAWTFNPFTGKLDAIDKSAGEWGSITGTLSDQTDLVTELDTREDQAIMYALML